MKPLVILTGPTAVGKTGLSIKLAKKINGEIISADSMQVYKGMDIGSAKISPDEKEGINHYLIDEFEIDYDFNVYEFQKLAKNYIEQIYSHGKLPIIVGGTGFYIQAILKDIDFTDSNKDEEYRNSLYELAKTEGPIAVHKLLEEIDPKAASEIHANNVKRVIRALEYAKDTGELISEHNEKEKAKQSPFNFAYYVLNRDRQNLYNRIDQRVDIMMQEGLLEEVKKLKELGAKEDMTSMQGLGYKEILGFLNGKYASLDDAIYDIKLNTRHFAKRQLTWFKRESDVTYLDLDSYNEDDLLDFIANDLRCKGII